LAQEENGSSFLLLDTTEFTLLKRVRTELPHEAEELLKGRVQMIK